MISILLPIVSFLPWGGIDKWRRQRIGTGKLNKQKLTECKCFTNGVPVLYAVTRESGSDEVAGLQRDKQASNPILRKFSRAKVARRFFVHKRDVFVS